MGKWGALGGSPKKKPKKKVDIAVVMKVEEMAIKKDKERLERIDAEDCAAKIKLEEFEGDEDDIQGDKETTIVKPTIDVEAIRQAKREEAHEAKRKRYAEIQDAKAKNKLKVVCKDILDMMNGRQYSMSEVIVDGDTMKIKSFTDVDMNISWDDRSRACEALWAFQFKGELHKEVVVELGGVELMIEILARPPKVHFADQFAVDAFSRHAIVCLRALASHEKNIPHIVDAGAVPVMIKLVDVSENDTKVLALETLACIAQFDKPTRKLLTGPNHRFLARLLGDKRAGQQNFHRLIKSGLEPYAMAAMHLVEVLLSKEEHRLFVLNETFVISVIRTVTDSKNMSSKGKMCRIILALCKSEQCRSAMQKLGVADFAAEFFLGAFHSESRALGCAALGTLVTSKDEELAKTCLPRIWDILTDPKSLASPEERAFMEIPGTLRALRAFCKQRWVQDMVVSRKFDLQMIANYIKDEAGSNVTRAEAAHIIGSIALQTKHHTTLMSLAFPVRGPLMKLIHRGDPIEKFSAARAVQNLTYFPQYCQKFAEFVDEDVHWDLTSGKDVVKRWDALQAVTNLCRPTAASNHKTHGAAILRNFASCDCIRKRVMRYFKKGVPMSPGNLLTKLLCENSLVVRTHACAAIGNLCSTEENARIICYLQGGKVVQDVANLMYAEPETSEDKPFALESRVSAMTTLTLLACDEECAKEVLETGRFSLCVHPRKREIEQIQNHLYTRIT